MVKTTNNEHPTVFESTYNGASRGAFIGSMVGGTIVTILGANALMQVGLETMSRNLGNEPKLLISREDCQLSQFQDLQACHDPHVFTSFTAFTVTVLTVTTATGTLIGGIKGFAESFFSKIKHT